MHDCDFAGIVSPIVLVVVMPLVVVVMMVGVEVVAVPLVRVEVAQAASPARQFS